jgi:hypothetical protein
VRTSIEYGVFFSEQVRARRRYRGRTKQDLELEQKIRVYELAATWGGQVLFALVGEVIKVEGLGVRELEDDFGTGSLPSGAQASEFAGFES